MQTKLSVGPAPFDRGVGVLGGDVEAIYKKAAWHVLPFLVTLFVIAWLDRVNVGFAKLQMQQDLGFSDTAFGLGAGIFYIGYLLFEVPSNLLLERIGARKTLARIAILYSAKRLPRNMGAVG